MIYMHHETLSRSCLIFPQCQLFQASLAIKIKQLECSGSKHTALEQKCINADVCLKHLSGGVLPTQSSQHKRTFALSSQ